MSVEVATFASVQHSRRARFNTLITSLERESGAGAIHAIVRAAPLELLSNPDHIHVAKTSNMASINQTLIYAMEAFLAKSSEAIEGIRLDTITRPICIRESDLANPRRMAILIRDPYVAEELGMRSKDMKGVQDLCKMAGYFSTAASIEIIIAGNTRKAEELRELDNLLRPL